MAAQQAKPILKYSVWGGVLVIFLTIVTLFTMGWCRFLGENDFQRASTAFALCAASFCAGSVIGFMFSIFGDEQEPFGKIRDAMIALASGITGVGIARAADFGAVLSKIHIFATGSPQNDAFPILIAIAYFIIGFFFMYFFRKLAINPALHESKEAMDRWANSSKVGSIASNLGERLSPTLLLGREFIEDVEEMDPEEVSRLRKILFGDDVQAFLAACEEDARSGISISPDSVALAARLHYYRIYFEKEGTDPRSEQENTALEWIQRALMQDPTSPDFQIRLGDVFAMQSRHLEAVSIFERLERDENSPQYVQQWLGYLLLFLKGREKDAIRHSLEFHDRFPDEASGLYNAACGYAQLYEIEMNLQKRTEDTSSKNRLQSLEYLRRAIEIDSDLKALAVKHSEDGDSFASLRSDPDFRALVATSTDRV